MPSSQKILMKPSLCLLLPSPGSRPLILPLTHFRRTVPVSNTRISFIEHFVRLCSAHQHFFNDFLRFFLDFYFLPSHTDKVMSGARPDNIPHIYIKTTRIIIKRAASDGAVEDRINTGGTGILICAVRDLALICHARSREPRLRLHRKIIFMKPTLRLLLPSPPPSPLVLPFTNFRRTVPVSNTPISLIEQFVSWHFVLADIPLDEVKVP